MTARTLEALLAQFTRDIGLLKRRTAKIPRPVSPPLLASVGDVKITTRVGAQTGWLPAAGGTFLIAEYPDLYDVVGTRYATGGEATGRFRVPNVDTSTLGPNLVALIKA